MALSHKGFTGDTLVHTRLGVRDFKSLFPEPSPHRGPLKQGSPYPPFYHNEADPATDGDHIQLILGDSQLPAANLFYFGIQETIRVITKSGKSITGHAAQPVLAYERNEAKIRFVSLSKLNTSHSLIGTVTNLPHITPSLKPYRGTRGCDILGDDFMRLSLTGQVNRIVDALAPDCIDHISPTTSSPLGLIVPTYEMAMTVSSVVGMAGCFSRITKFDKELGHHAVTILPVSNESSSLHQLLFLCDREEGVQAYQALRQSFRPDGRSIHYTDPVVSTVRVMPSPLYSLDIRWGHDIAYTVNGFIVAAPAAN